MTYYRMRILDYLKDYYNLHGKAINWAVIEETGRADDSHKLKPCLYIRGSRVYVDLYARRLFSTISLREFERKVYVAKKENVGDGKIVLVAKDDASRYIVLPKTFVADIHNVTRYGQWMEEQLLL